MSNRRVKSLGYEDDGYDDDDYGDELDEGGELSTEDQEQMRQGTIKVRETLGTQYSISDAEIEDALWNYYYDVGKSVTFLKNKHKPKQAPRSKSTPNKVPLDFFDDCPWGRIPSHRQALIIEEHIHPRGLLGGSSGKMSKLAALAAKRRQKESNPAVSPESGDYTAALSKLTIQPKKVEEINQKPSEQESEPKSEPEEAKKSEVEVPLVTRGQPSSFANTIIASSQPLSIVDHLQLSKEDKAFDFSEPSPDDIIYKAQTGRSRT